MLRSYHDVDYYKPRRHFCNLHRHNFLADHVDLVDLGACGGGDDGGGGGGGGGGEDSSGCGGDHLLMKTLAKMLVN